MLKITVGFVHRSLVPRRDRHEHSSHRHHGVPFHVRGSLGLLVHGHGACIRKCGEVGNVVIKCGTRVAARRDVQLISMFFSYSTLTLESSALRRRRPWPAGPVNLKRCL